MSVRIRYDAFDRMILEGLECDCPCEHSLPIRIFMWEKI